VKEAAAAAAAAATYLTGALLLPLLAELGGNHARVDS